MRARGFWSRRGSVLRPAAGLADVDEAELGFRKILRDFPKQRLFLGAGDRDRRALGERLLELVEVEAAKLVRLAELCRAATADRFRVERHGLLATANQEARRRRTHFVIPLTRCIKRVVALSRSSAGTAP